MMWSHALNRFTVSAWNLRIREAVNQGHARSALFLFRHMKRDSQALPNNLTFPLIAKACGMLLEFRLSQLIHAHVVKTPFLFDVYVQTALVDAYVKCNHLECAYNLFDEMSYRDLASWNAIILGFARMGCFSVVSSLLNSMRIDGVIPDSVTIMGLTQLVSGMNDLVLLRAVHCFGIKCGSEDVVPVANTWIAGYAKCGDLRSSEVVFFGIDYAHLTTVSWNAFISGCCYVENSTKSLGIYRQMLGVGYRPDLSTIINLLSSFSQPEYLCYGMLVHAHGIQIGCDEDVSLLNTLVSMYSKCGDIDSARYIFDSMHIRSQVSWTVMIGGYSSKGDLDEALSMFHAMEATGEQPDPVSIVHLISGCAKVGALQTGKWIDDYASSKGLKGNVMLCNALLDMYAKCGSIRDTEKLFRTMNTKTVVSWTTLVAGYALHGRFKEALTLLDQMLMEGLEPNAITFLAALQACTHAGLLKEGCELFDKMTRVYRLNPGLDHYACMADLLGRKGKVKEAFKFIQDMPMEPDTGVWGALLSACRTYRDVEIAECVVSNLEHKEAAVYVEMANIYASAKEWGDFAVIRREMRSKQVVKTPGRSVIQLNGKCHAFAVEDRCHFRSFLVFEALDSLVMQLKDQVDLFTKQFNDESSIFFY